MTIEKLPSGKYRAKIMKDHKMYRITYDYKPTKKEAENDLYALIQEKTEKKNGKLTFEEAADKYIDIKKNVLSPSTIRSYTVIKRNLSKWFLELPIDKISQVELNKQVNELALNHSPKTVRNQHGFISSVLGTFRPELQIYTTLPQKRKIEPYIPSDEDVKKLLEALKETDAYVPLILAVWGMRRGEILALLPSDVEEDGTVHITKSAVYDIDGNLVIKEPKTTYSTRDIIIPVEVAKIIHERGYVYKGHHQYVTKKMREYEKKLGLQRFTLHKLRHYFASKMLTITDRKTVQALGGWKTDAVLKTVYEHSMKDEQEKAKRLAVEQLKNTLL